MSVNDLIKKLQSIPSKQRDLDIVIRVDERVEGITNMFMGVNSDSGLNFPQIGEEPNCVVIKIADTPTDTVADDK